LKVGEQLSLAVAGSRQHPLSIDFRSAQLNYRRQHGGRFSQSLAKAVGLKTILKKEKTPLVLDCTAGLGRDAFMLASWGCRVLMVEQSRVLALMLEEALALAAMSPVAEIIDNLELRHDDSLGYLQAHAEASRPCVIYLDPMFPERKQTAKVKGELQILHKLHDSEVFHTDELLLAAALEIPNCRIVFKRPSSATPVSSRLPGYQVKGKTTRFDVYLSRAGSEEV